VEVIAAQRRSMGRGKPDAEGNSVQIQADALCAEEHGVDRRCWSLRKDGAAGQPEGIAGPLPGFGKSPGRWEACGLSDDCLHQVRRGLGGQRFPSLSAILCHGPSCATGKEDPSPHTR
jgi:hypothetical protein